MSKIKIKRIPLTFKCISWKINFHEMKFVPFLIIFVNIICMTMSLPAMGMQIISYGVQGCDILGFAFISFLCLKDKEITRYGLSYIIFFFFLNGLTIIYLQDIKNCIYMTINIFLNLLLFRYYRNKIKFIVCSYAVALSFCVYVNFLHLITHPALWIIEEEKEGSGYLLGFNYNQMGCRMMLALVTCILCKKFSYIWKINFFILTFVSIVTLSIVGSMTSLSMIVVFFIYSFIPVNKLRRIGLIALFCTYILFQTVVVFSGKGLENNEIAVYFIEDILHKDITFTHRTNMWDSALKTIAKSPVFGWGYVSTDWYKSFMSSQAIGPHNFILSIFINGGVLLFSSFLVIVYKSYNVMEKHLREREGQYLIFGTICLYFMALMEMYSYSIMFYLFTIMFYYPYITKQTSKEDTTK